MSLNKMVQGVNYDTTTLRENVNGLIDDTEGSLNISKSLKEVDTVVFLGTSIMFLMTESNTNPDEYMPIFIDGAAKKGITINEALARGVSGSLISGSQSQWDAIKDSYTGKSNVLVVVESLVNEYLTRAGETADVWGTISDSEKNSIISQYQNLVDSIELNGNNCFIIGNNYVNRDGLVGTDDRLGMKPFNDNVIRPIAKKNAISWFNNDLRCDLYPFSRYYPDYIKEAPDLVHPEEGKGLCQQRAYLFESIYRLINGEPPLKNLYDGEQYPERCIVGFGTPDTDFKSKESANTKGLVMFTRDLDDPSSQEQRGLIPLSKEAFRPCSIRVDSYQDGSSVLGTGVIIDSIHTPTNDLSLYCKDASDRGIIVLDTSNFVDMFKVYGLNANQTGQITFRSIYTDDGSTTRREGRFSVDGGATFVDAVAATGFINLGNPSVHKLDFTADSSGAFTFSAKALVDFAIVNCIEIYPS